MPPRYSLDYFEPPADLSRHVLVLFHFVAETELIEDVQPGALGQLVIFPKGTGLIGFNGSVEEVTGKAHLLSSFSAAARFKMRGPWHAVGASLSPLGWAALTKASLADHVDRFFPAAELLGEEAEKFGESLSGAYNTGDLGGQAACHALADWIAPRLGKVLPAHVKLIEATTSWLNSALNPDLDGLFGGLAYSRRQVERLVERYFGLPPAALARKYRAIRSAAMLAKDELSDEEQAVIAMAYHDQPHMIREIRKYCGYTPTRLGGEGHPILNSLLQLRNFSQLQEFQSS